MYVRMDMMHTCAAAFFSAGELGFAEESAHMYVYVCMYVCMYAGELGFTDESAHMYVYACM